MAASKFRLNRYNWFGQKLLAQHQYGDIIKLRQYLTTNATFNQDDCYSERPTSEHLSYIHGLALMKTSIRLDEVIFSIQRLNFDRNNQYFLLLCQCLLYLGNYDSVVALCRQLINREIDKVVTTGADNEVDGDEQETSIAATPTTTTTTDTNKDQPDDDDNDPTSAAAVASGVRKMFGEKRRRLFLPGSSASVSSEKLENMESRRVMTSISRNPAINEPKLWFIFGLCLEYQLQYKDAHFAYKVASELAAGRRNGPQQSQCELPDVQADSLLSPAGDASRAPRCLSNYFAPHAKYAEFCLRQRADLKSASQILAKACRFFPQNFTLNPLLALVCSLPGKTSSNQKAMAMLAALEAHCASNRNPSIGYNNLALSCKQKLQPVDMFLLETHCFETGDENRSNLDYILIKGHITINSLIDYSGSSSDGGGGGGGPATMRLLSAGTSTCSENCINNRLDKLIDALKVSSPNCWSSASLWNNLGLCYLMKKRFVACLSCLVKAHHINPLDWRINYNLAVACVHVGLMAKALTCLLAAKNLYLLSQSNGSPSSENRRRAHCEGYRHSNPLITTLLDVCLAKLVELTGPS